MVQTLEGSASRRFRAFLSYSRADDRTARWLHGELERFRTPKDLVGAAGTHGAVERRVAPVFRDRTDLSSGGVLQAKLIEAIRDSEFLVVLCSPSSAKSAYVNAEIQQFIDEGRADHILPVIVSGEPWSGSDETECMAPALRTLELLAADLRDIKLENARRIGDGREGGKFKLIAGMLGVPLDALLQRERRRQRARAAAGTAMSLVFLALAVVASGAAYVAYQNEQEARRQTAAAQASADFLVSTFEVAIPALENPDTITARTILDRGAARVRGEFAREPGTKARLLDAMARAYNHLGLHVEARALIERDISTIRGAGADGVQALLTLARAYRQGGDYERALAAIDQAESQLNASGRNRPDLRGYVHETRAVMRYDLGETEAAIALYESAIVEYGRAERYNQVDIGRALNNQGLALIDLGRYDDADRVLRQAGRLYAQSSGEQSLLYGQNLYALALNASSAGELDAAARYIAQSRAVLEPLLQAQNPMIGDIRSLVGQIALSAGNYESAAQNLSSAVEIYDQAFGGPNISSGIALYYLATVRIAQNQFVEAIAVIDAAKRNYDSAYEPYHANQGDLLILRSVALRGAGQATEADAACVEGMGIIVRSETAQSPMYQDALQHCPAATPTE